MLKHLWQSLIAVLRRPRLSSDEQMYWLQTEQYKIQQNAYQHMVNAGTESSAALQAMVETLQKMIEHTKPLKVARYGTYEMVDDDGCAR